MGKRLAQLNDRLASGLSLQKIGRGAATFLIGQHCSS
jgi:hypothetical protein